MQIKYKKRNKLKQRITMKVDYGRTTIMMKFQVGLYKDHK